MKKLIITTISVFVLVNFAFAQSAQQKVDSLKKEQAKAEKTKQLTDDRLRLSQTDQNYQAAKAAREKVEQVNKELESALTTLKAEEEAKARAKAEAAAKAKAEEERRLEALYQNNFSQFSYAGINRGMVKDYIIEQLRKDPNWQIHRVNVVFDELYDGYDEYQCCRVIIESTSGIKDFDYGTFCPEEYFQVKEWYDNPEEYYFFRKLYRMQTDVVNYYKEYTGRTYDIKDAIINKKCKSVEFYYIDVPNQNNSNFNFNQNNNSAFMKRQKEVDYIYAVCGSDSKENIIIRPNHSYFDKIYAEKHPRKTIKTFKIEDYMK